MAQVKNLNLMPTEMSSILNVKIWDQNSSIHPLLTVTRAMLVESHLNLTAKDSLPISTLSNNIVLLFVSSSETIKSSKHNSNLISQNH